MNARHTTHKSRLTKTTKRKHLKDAFEDADKNQLKPMSNAEYDAYMKGVYAQRIINDKKRAEQEQVAAERYALMKKEFIKVENEMHKKKTTKQHTLNMGDFRKLIRKIDRKKVEVKQSIKNIMDQSHGSTNFDYEDNENRRKEHEKIQKEIDRLARR